MQNFCQLLGPTGIMSLREGSATPFLGPDGMQLLFFSCISWSNSSYPRIYKSSSHAAGMP